MSIPQYCILMLHSIV